MIPFCRPFVYWGHEILLTSLNTQEDGRSKLRHTEQVTGGQMRKSFPVLLGCKAQAPKKRIILPPGHNVGSRKDRSQLIPQKLHTGHK